MASYRWEELEGGEARRRDGVLKKDPPLVFTLF